jgi:hypothetical protein
VIEIDPLWRLVVVLAAFGVIPLLLALGWAVLCLGMSLHQGGLSTDGVWRGDRHRHRAARGQPLVRAAGAEVTRV